MSLTELLNSGGGKTFKFAQIGDSVTGTVESAEVMQKRNFDSGEPEYWSDGKPMQQVRISLSTSLRDPSDPEDDGARSVYVKGWGDDLRALRSAIKQAGADDIEPGGKFTATYARDGELPAGKRGFAPKVKEYTYAKPSTTAGLVGDQEAAPQPAQQAAPAQQAVPTAADPLATLTPEQRAAVQAMTAQQQSGS